MVNKQRKNRKKLILFKGKYVVVTNNFIRYDKENSQIGEPLGGS